MNKRNKYLLKVNHKNYIFQNIILEHKLRKPKNSSEIEEKKETIEEENNDKKEENLNVNINENDKSNKNKNQSVEDKINILFMNSLKIIIRQDELSQNFIDKIKNSIKHEKEKTTNKNIVSKLASSEENSRK